MQPLVTHATVVTETPTGWVVIDADGVRRELSRENVPDVRHLRPGQRLTIERGESERAWIGTPSPEVSSA